MGRMTEEDFFFDSGSYLDTRPFRAYARQIRDLIHAAASPLSIGDIHRLLADGCKRHWTADAIDSIKDIEPCGLLPTRYRPFSRPIRGLHTERSERWAIKPPHRKEPDFMDFTKH
ncbi:MAG: hypothetical protein IT173_12055 [Acidobacteria bacterium]|nr:hypothetical protein [Acidobacteriota bacterium]